MDILKIVQIGEVKYKNNMFLKIQKINNVKLVRAFVFIPFAIKPLNKIWCNQLPSEVTLLVK